MTIKQKIKLVVAGETLTLEWDRVFRGYVVNVFRREGHTYEGKPIHGFYSLGRVYQRDCESGQHYWGNDGLGCVKHMITCETLEAAAERMVRLFQQEHPRRS
jgi:hypothetical protein